jgi:hypothetical protein
MKNQNKKASEILGVVHAAKVAALLLAINIKVNKI